VASVLVLGGGAVLPRVSDARTAVEQRCPGHRMTCVDIPRHAKHTRRPRASSQAFGGPTPVERCTQRRWDTSDCRQPHPVGEDPSRRAHLGIQQTHMPDGWAEARVRGCDRGPTGWDMCPVDPSPDDSSIFMGAAAGGGESRLPPCSAPRTGSGSVSFVLPGESRLA